MKSRIFIKYFSDLRKSVSIIGSGPSGFYAAHYMLSKSKIPLDITIWEKLPIPFGLSRYGVAPDHPEVKNCENTFKLSVNSTITPCTDPTTSIRAKTSTEDPSLFGLSTAKLQANKEINANLRGKNHSFKFVGNLTIGEDISLETLYNSQDAVILSYGCSDDNKLGIENEYNTSGVFTSREFVNWYNGHPDYSTDEKLTNFNWSNVKKVCIIGNGNVALDITRLLLSNQIKNIWETTDINPVALKCLNRAPIEEVKLIARRDFPHSKFTNKELRELWELEKYGIRGMINKKFFTPEKWNMQTSSRSFKRCVEMCDEFLKPFDQRTKKYSKKYPLPEVNYARSWELDYLKTPICINNDNKRTLKSLTLCENEISPKNEIIKHKTKISEYQTDILITSLGYCGSPLPGFSNIRIKFDKGHIANDKGRVLDYDNNIIPNLYTSGWIRKGGRGIIMTTMVDSFAVADVILQDLYKSTSSKTKNIDISNFKTTTWQDWLKIDEREKKLGADKGKIRDKMLTKKEIFQFLGK